MRDTIPTTRCHECGELAPADAWHACRGDRREVLADVASERVFVDILAAARAPR